MLRDGDGKRDQNCAVGGSHNEKIGPPYDWSEIEYFLAHTPSHVEDNGDVAPAPQSCQFCGDITTQIWWESHPKTWKFRCGAAGFLDYCPNCRAWYPIFISVMG